MADASQVTIGPRRIEDIALDLTKLVLGRLVTFGGTSAPKTDDEILALYEKCLKAVTKVAT